MNNGTFTLHPLTPGHRVNKTPEETIHRVNKKQIKIQHNKKNNTKMKKSQWQLAALVKGWHLSVNNPKQMPSFLTTLKLAACS